MSLLLYSKIPGTQVKRDANLSNATVQCDPTLLFPQGATQGGVPLNKENLAGKIAVEHDICNLDVNNLTVNGTLISNGPAQICDIVCPEDFTVTAGNNIIETAGGAVSLLAQGGDIVATSSTGKIDLEASTGQILLDALGTANLFGTAGVKVQGNNAKSTTATGNQSGGSLNVFPQQAGAKGLHVVCTDTVAGEFGIAADLTGTTILRADGRDANTGATGHLCFAPSGAASPNIDPTITVAGLGVTTGTMLVNSADTCGQFDLTMVAGQQGSARIIFAKEYPTTVTNVFISPVNDIAASAILDGYFVVGTNTNFIINFSINNLTSGGTARFNYLVMDVVETAQQHG